MAVTFSRLSPTGFNVLADIVLGGLVLLMAYAVQLVFEEGQKRKILSGKGIPAGELGGGVPGALEAWKKFREGHFSSLVLAMSALAFLLPFVHPLSLVGVDFQSVPIESQTTAIYTFLERPQSLPLSYHRYDTVVNNSTLPFKLDNVERAIAISKMARDVEFYGSPYCEIVPTSQARHDFGSFRQGFGFGALMEANTTHLAELREGLVSTCPLSLVGQHVIMEESTILADLLDQGSLPPELDVGTQPVLTTPIDACPLELVPTRQIADFDNGRSIRLLWTSEFSVANTGGSQIDLSLSPEVEIRGINSIEVYTGGNNERTRQDLNDATVLFRGTTIRNAVLRALDTYDEVPTVLFVEGTLVSTVNQYRVFTIDGSLSGTECATAAQDFGVSLVDAGPEGFPMRNEEGIRFAPKADSCFVRTIMMCPTEFAEDGDEATVQDIREVDSRCFMSEVELQGFENLNVLLLDVLAISSALDPILPGDAITFSTNPFAIGFDKEYAKLPLIMAGLSTRIVATSYQEPVTEVRPVVRNWAIVFPVMTFVLACIVILLTLVKSDTRLWLPSSVWEGFVLHERDVTGVATTDRIPDPTPGAMFFGFTHKHGSDNLGLTAHPQEPTSAFLNGSKRLGNTGPLSGGTGHDPGTNHSSPPTSTKLPVYYSQTGTWSSSLSDLSQANDSGGGPPAVVSTSPDGTDSSWSLVTPGMSGVEPILEHGPTPGDVSDEDFEC